MRCVELLFVALVMVFAIGIANAQLVIDDFDSGTPGTAPAWRWWHNGSAGTIEIDDSVFRGASGSSVELVRTSFNGQGFGFGRNFRPLVGRASLSFYFRVQATADEVLTVIGGNNADHEVAWWIAVGGPAGDAIATYSDSSGWNHVMDVDPDTWYGVRLDIDPSAFTYDITVWEDDTPTNTVTESSIEFRSGSAAATIDQIQFGNFGDHSTGNAVSAHVDDVRFSGSHLTVDGFETGNTSGWSTSTRPVTFVNTCFQTVSTDAILGQDLDCSAGPPDIAVELTASGITFDLNGHTITGPTLGIGVSTQNVEAVTVKNGTIENTDTGLDFYLTTHGTASDLQIRNLIESDPNEFRNGIRVTRSHSISVRDCFFEFLQVAHKNSIVAASSDMTIDNIEVNNASLGAHISGDTGIGNLPSQVSITNSRLLGITIAGILVSWTDDSLVAHNEFDFNETAVSVDTGEEDAVTGLVIEDNAINRNAMAIHFMGGSDSSVLNNVLRGHGRYKGIFLDTTMGCPTSGYDPSCLYANNIVVSGNHATGAFLDLSHHEYALGNTWTDNLCQTKQGAEIPDCTLSSPER